MARRKPAKYKKYFKTYNDLIIADLVFGAIVVDKKNKDFKLIYNNRDLVNSRKDSLLKTAKYVYFAFLERMTKEKKKEFMTLVYRLGSAESTEIFESMLGDKTEERT